MLEKGDLVKVKRSGSHGVVVGCFPDGVRAWIFEFEGDAELFNSFDLELIRSESDSVRILRDYWGGPLGGYCRYSIAARAIHELAQIYKRKRNIGERRRKFVRHEKIDGLGVVSEEVSKGEFWGDLLRMSGRDPDKDEVTR